MHAGIGLGEASKNCRQLVRHEVLGYAEADLAADRRLSQAPDRFVVEVQDTPRVAEQGRACGGEGERAAGSLEHPVADDLFEALDLHADGGLCARDKLRRGGETAGVSDRGEAAQQVDVEVGGVHDFIY
jgi:hypothetical protein